LVLVSSKGSIILIIEELSATDRGLVYEIGDVDEGKATEYLMEMDFVEDRAEKVVSCLEKRLVYLQSCLKLTDDILSDDICYNI